MQAHGTGRYAHGGVAARGSLPRRHHNQTRGGSFMATLLFSETATFTLELWGATSAIRTTRLRATRGHARLGRAAHRVLCGYARIGRRIATILLPPAIPESSRSASFPRTRALFPRSIRRRREREIATMPYRPHRFPAGRIARFFSAGCLWRSPEPVLSYKRARELALRLVIPFGPLEQFSGSLIDALGLLNYR